MNTPKIDRLRTIILDLDETLVHRSDNTDDLDRLNIWNQNPLIRARTFSIEWTDGNKCWMIKRPYLTEFLAECFNRFDQVIVWSAGGKSYVDAVVTHIFSGLPTPHYVFCNQHCVNYELEYRYLHKPILHLKNYNVDVDINNTVIIDDREANFIDNVRNGARIREYKPPPCVARIQNDDDECLLELIRWMRSTDFDREMFTFNNWMSC